MENRRALTYFKSLPKAKYVDVSEFQNKLIADELNYD